jgi:hypothetical protein
VKQNEYLFKHDGTSALTQTSAALCGGIKISKKPSHAFTVRPTTMRPPTSETRSCFCRTSSAATVILQVAALCKTPWRWVFEPIFKSVYIFCFNSSYKCIFFTHKYWNGCDPMFCSSIYEGIKASRIFIDYSTLYKQTQEKRD